VIPFVWGSFVRFGSWIGPLGLFAVKAFLFGGQRILRHLTSCQRVIMGRVIESPVPRFSIETPFRHRKSRHHSRRYS
jgi:hypothetical protein